MAAYKDEERGTWYVSFYYEDWTGAKKRKVKRGFRTKKEALNFEAEYKRTAKADMDMTMGEFVEVYFLSKSIAIYEKEVNSLQVLLGGMKIQQEKGNISLMEISRLESMLFSLRKEKHERENDLLTTRGELNLLLNLPEDTSMNGPTKRSPEAQ